MKIFLIAICLILWVARVKSVPSTIFFAEYKKKLIETENEIKQENSVIYLTTAFIVTILFIWMYLTIGTRCSNNLCMTLSVLQAVSEAITLQTICRPLHKESTELYYHTWHVYHITMIVFGIVYYPLVVYFMLGYTL